MKQRIAQYIMQQYPNAELEYFFNTKWGAEYTFYPTPDADNPYTCVLNSDGTFTILTDF